MDNAVFAFLRRLAARLRGRIRPIGPPDPAQPIREPRPNRPGGSRTAAAVAEPDPPIFVHAITRSGARRTVSPGDE